MFLTQLQLDPRHAAARRDLANAYDMHRTLVRALVESDSAEPPRVLWRLEPSMNWAQATVLVQSHQPGRWDALPAGYLASPQPPAFKALVFDTWLSAGARLRFRLVANPVVCRQGKRLGLVGEDDQLGWLQRQAQAHGFELESALVLGQHRLKAFKSGHAITLQQVHFEGVLKVTDPVGLAQAVSQGVGPGKAMGCGLLSLGRLA